MSRPLLAEYVAAGWVLVPFPGDRKGPVAKDWSQRDRCISDPEIAEHLDGNVGLCHAYSGTCSLDIDNLEEAADWLADRGINVYEYLQADDAVILSSGRENRAKLIYALPAPLQSFNLGPFELRCGTRAGTTVQDVLPPSIHPETGRPYVWVYNAMAAHWSRPPKIPSALHALWLAQIKPDNKLPTERKPRSADLGKARALLDHHNPDGTYEAWLQAGMALHHETKGGIDGLDLWDEWSARGTKYKGRADLDSHWRSFNAETSNPVTIASLRVDTPAETEEFPVVTAEMVDEAKLPKVRNLDALAEVVNTLLRDKNGKALALLQNLAPLLGLSEVTGQHIAYDSFKDVLVCAPYGTDLWRPIKDTDYTALRIWLETTGNFYPVSKDLVRDTIYYVAEQNEMDTAKDWLMSIKWDGVERVKKFIPRYFGSVDAKYERSVGEYLWTALAGRVMEPGCQVDMAIILVGDQGIGKSRGVQALVPDPDFYVEIRLDDHEDNLARKMRGALIGEIAELRGLRNAELERTKAFITRTHEKWTPKYVEFATTFARRVVFIGTTNEEEFLVDRENRRWLPVRTAGVDVEAIVRDREQLWAEALQIWMANGVHWQDAQVLAKDEHAAYKVTDVWLPIVQQWIADHPDATVLKSHDVMTQAVGLDARHITRAQELRTSNVLRELGYVRKLTRVDGKVARAWVKE